MNFIDAQMSLRSQAVHRNQTLHLLRQNVASSYSAGLRESFDTISLERSHLQLQHLKICQVNEEISCSVLSSRGHLVQQTESILATAYCCGSVYQDFFFKRCANRFRRLCRLNIVVNSGGHFVLQTKTIKLFFFKQDLLRIISIQFHFDLRNC